MCILMPCDLMAKTHQLFNHLGNDLKYTFNGWPLAIILGGGVVTMGASQFDNSINKRLGKADKAAEIAGSIYVIDGGSLVLFGVGELAHNKEIALTGEALLESLFFTEAVTGGIKLAANRTRPDGSNYSFPSAHAARVFAMATVLETLHGPVIGIPAYLAAGFISFTRLDSNVHFLSDIVFGAALGTAFGWGTAEFHKEHRNFSVVPSVGRTKGLNVVFNF